MKPILIGLHGPTGVGKDTVCNIIRLISPVETQRLAFGDALKAAVKAAFGLSDEWLQDDLKTVTHPYWKLTPREMFQLAGTEAFRGTFGADFWVRRLEMAMEADTQYFGMFVVTDVRFESEANWIRERGGMLVHMSGPQRRADVSHAHSSNTPLPKVRGDYNLPNLGSLKMLNDDVRDLVDRVVAAARETANA
jgi:hypothetical protein